MENNLPGNWKRSELGKLGDFRNGANFNKSQFGPGLPIINVKNLYRSRYVDIRNLEELKPDALSNPDLVAVEEGDILFARSSVKASGAGQVAMVKDYAPKTIFSGFVIRFRVTDSDSVDKLYLNYLLRSPKYRELLTRIATGTTISNLSQTQLAKLPIDLPPLDEQKAIAHILGTLDDKIELNQQMNRTLEGIARALFKSWFIDFDPVRAKLDGRLPSGMDAETAALFPDAFEDGGAIGPIPKGWQVQRLEEMTTKIGSGATPRGGSKVYVDEGISLIRSQNVYDYEFRWDGLAHITEDTATQLKNVVVERDDILLNITGDSILRTCVVEPSVLPARVNQHVAIIRPEPEIPCRYLHLYLVHPQMKSLMLGFDTGATRKAITKGQLESLPILLPTDDVLRCFDRLTNHLFQQVQSNIVESRALAAMRDVLLPKLLSGEIRANEAKQAMEAVA